MTSFFSILLTFICCLGGAAFAQNDSSYYVSYEDQLTARFYFSQKYTSFRYNEKTDDISLRYFPNTTLNMGVGATYKSASLNLAYGFGFLNPEGGKGETKYLDLQGHFYSRKFFVDVLGQFYRGFYLVDQDLRDVSGNYYTRPDLRTAAYGLSGHYMPNYERFSYRAGFLQNEWQKRSAGTLLLGWQIIWGSAKADSALVPFVMSGIHTEPVPQQLNYFETGPSIGYAYTLVIKQHFFLMGSASAAIAFGTHSIQAEEFERSRSFIPNFSLKAFAGYNAEKWAISLTFTNETHTIGNITAKERFALDSGNLRLNFVRRFILKRDLLEELKEKTGIGR